MQFIVALIADDTAVCDMVAVNIYGFRKAVVIVKEISALGIENIPYPVNFHDICNVAVYT